MYYIGIDSGLYGYKSGLETSYISNCADVQGIFTGQSVTKNKSVRLREYFWLLSTKLQNDVRAPSTVRLSPTSQCSRGTRLSCLFMMTEGKLSFY